MPTGVYKRTKPVWNKGVIGIMTAWNKGLTKTDPRVESYARQLRGRKCPQISDRQMGKNNHMFGKFESASGRWVGDKIQYRGLHKWVESVLGKPNRCSFCHKAGSGKCMHWASVNHEYERKTENWLRLCASCHKKYDLKLLII